MKRTFIKYYSFRYAQLSQNLLLNFSRLWKLKHKIPQNFYSVPGITILIPLNVSTSTVTVDGK